MLDRLRRGLTKMTYGPQGNPVTVSNTPPTPPPSGALPMPPGPHEPVPLSSVTVAVAAAPVAEVVDERNAEERLAGAESTMLTQAALIERIKALVSAWDTKSGRIPQKGDYQKGARLAIVECSDELRTILGI